VKLIKNVDATTASDTEVESEGSDYAVRFEDGFIYEAESAEDARQTAVMANGVVLVREVWVSAWAELVDLDDEEGA
jgi:hypothetical protein